MCVATLGVVVSRIGDGAIVEVGEQTRWVSATLFPETATGDYVLIAALTIVDRLDRPVSSDASSAGSQPPSLTLPPRGGGDQTVPTTKLPSHQYLTLPPREGGHRPGSRGDLLWDGDLNLFSEV